MKTSENSKARPAAGRTNRILWQRAAFVLTLVCLLPPWSGLAAADDAAQAAKAGKKALILVPTPTWAGDDENWRGPYDGPTARRMCEKILKAEAARLGIELTNDVKRTKECDGVLGLTPQSPKADVPVVDVLFQGHRGFLDALGTYGQKAWDLKRPRYLLASTADPEWLRTGLRLLKAAWQVRNARVCVVTDEPGVADCVHRQLGTTIHPVPPARLEEHIRKANDQEAAAVAADYMHQGRMQGTIEGTSGYQKMKEEKWHLVDPKHAEKARQDTIAAAKFYLGCRNLLAAEKCQALALSNQARYGAAPVIAFAALADDGIAAAFDPDATLMLLLAGSLLERAGFVHGPLVRQGENVFLASYFTCPTRLPGYDFEPPASFSIGPGPQGKDFGIQVRWRKGDEITRLQLKDSKLLFAKGKVCYSDITVKDGHRTAVFVQLEDKPGRPEPSDPNCVIVYGDCTNEMSCIARLLDLDFPAAAGVLVPR